MSAQGDQHRAASSHAWTNDWARPPPYQLRIEERIDKEGRLPARDCCHFRFGSCVDLLLETIVEFWRCILILINTMFAITGAAFIVIGTILHFSKTLSASFINLVASSTTLVSNMVVLKTESLTEFHEISAEYINKTTTILICLGIVIFVISVIGLYGASKRSQCLLRVYILFIAGLTLLLVIFVILLDNKQQSLRYASHYYLTSQFTAIYGNGTMFTNMFNAFMQLFQCCGVENGTDFIRLKNTEWKETFQQRVPDSCCIRQENVVIKCTEKPTINNSYENIGCFKKVWSVIECYSEKLVRIFSVIVIILLGHIFLTWSIIKNANLEVYQ